MNEQAHISRRFQPPEEHLRGLEEAGRYILGNGATGEVRAFFDGTGNIRNPEKPAHWSMAKWKQLVVSQLRAILPPHMSHSFKGFLVFKLNQGALSGGVKLIPA